MPTSKPKPTQPKVTTCPTCGTPWPAGAAVCAVCGTRIEQPDDAPFYAYLRAIAEATQAQAAAAEATQQAVAALAAQVEALAAEQGSASHKLARLLARPATSPLAKLAELGARVLQRLLHWRAPRLLVGVTVPKTAPPRAPHLPPPPAYPPGPAPAGPAVVAAGPDGKPPDPATVAQVTQAYAAAQAAQNPQVAMMQLIGTMLYASTATNFVAKDGTRARFSSQ